MRRIIKSRDEFKIFYHNVIVGVVILLNNIFFVNTNK